MTFAVRSFVPSDADACLRLFRDCVHRVNVCDYTSEQIEAWAPLEMDSTMWAKRFEGRFACVACVGEMIVGFTDITRDGHLDRLFVSADHQRRGVARGLVERLMQHAEQQGFGFVTTEASVTAKPFFEAMGFVVMKQQIVERRGVSMTNFKMHKSVESLATQALAEIDPNTFA